VGVSLLHLNRSVSVREANLIRADPTLCTDSRHVPPTMPHSAEDAALRCEIVLMVNSRLRDQLIVKLNATGGIDATPAAGPFGIKIPCGRESQYAEFFPGLTTPQQALIVQALSGAGIAEPRMESVPFDMQFESSPSDKSNRNKPLRVVYGQETQGLYRTVPGPEALPCKMGPAKGGVVVLFRYLECKTTRTTFQAPSDHWDPYFSQTV
jgi:hypothetical protein